MGVGSAKDLNAAAGLIQQSIDEMIIFTEKSVSYTHLTLPTKA